RISPNDQVEIRIPATTEKPGQATFRVIATSGPHSDVNEFSLPVLTPRTTEAFATHGQIVDDSAVLQKIAVEPDVAEDAGGLQITTSSTFLQNLTDAFSYLQNYPYSCSEQLSSQILSIAMMKDVMQAFHAEDVPSNEKLDANLTNSLTLLQKRQRS